MEFKQLLQTRRSCRSFETAEVSEEDLQAILEAGQWAPSPLNLQPWEFVVITDPEVKARVKETGEDAKQEVADKGGPGWANKYGMDFMSEAPVLIVVLYAPSKGGLGDFFGQTDGALQAASACAQNMMLAAADMGYGSLWFTFFRPEKMKALLNIPENLEIGGIVPIGKPKGEMEAPPRKASKVHQERYGATS